MAMVVGNNMGVSNSYQNSTSKAGGYKNVREYSNYLMGKYSCLKPGNNVAVSVTSGLLRKAMSDEKTGQWLERELSKAPDYIKQAQQSASARGWRLVSCSIEFGEEYTISSDFDFYFTQIDYFYKQRPFIFTTCFNKRYAIIL